MREIRRILKEETAIPENIDKAMEDVLSGILNSPDEKTTGALSKKTDGERTKNSGNKKKIIRILLPVAAILGVSTGVLATNIGRLYKELEQQGVAEQEAAQMVVTEPESTAENVENITSYPITPEAVDWNQSITFSGEILSLIFGQSVIFSYGICQKLLQFQHFGNLMPGKHTAH